jgi:hypothetical protein
MVEKKMISANDVAVTSSNVMPKSEGHVIDDIVDIGLTFGLPWREIEDELEKVRLVFMESREEDGGL